MAAKCRILVVEDQPLVAETILSALTDDYDVTCGANATEAMARIENDAPDLVLLDCLLPGGRANEVIALADRRGVPVVLMSGAMDQIDTLSNGSRPFLAKPFSMIALAETVREVLPAHC